MGGINENPISGGDSYDPATITAQEYYERAAALLGPGQTVQMLNDFVELTGAILCKHKSYDGFDIRQMVDDLATLASHENKLIAAESRIQIALYMQEHASTDIFSTTVFIGALANAKEPFNASALRPRPASERVKPVHHRGGPQI